MNRQQKESVVDELKNSFVNSQALFLVSYKGLTVDQLQSLRKKLRTHGGHLKVAKARLMKLAAEGIDGVQDLEPYFKDQIGVVSAVNESPAVANVLNTFAKDNEALKLVIGCLDAHLINKSDIARIANLPSREVLLAQVCGGIKAPIAGFVSVLNVLLLRLLWTLKEIEAKKQQQ
jgi:large subunit ribosomal protein L10